MILGSRTHNNRLGALAVPQSNTGIPSRKLLLVCDYDGGLLHSLLETLDQIGLKDRVLIRKGKKVDWGDGTTKTINLPMRVHSEEYSVNVGSIVSLLAYLLIASIVGTVEVLRRRLNTVLAIFAFPQGLVAIIVGRLTRRKVAIMTDGGDVDVYLSNPWIRPIITACLRHATAVTALNRSKSDRLCALGIEPLISPTIGINTSRFDYVPFRRKEKRLVLFTGRLNIEKQLGVLIAACDRLHNDGITVKLLIVGDGPLRDEIEQTVICRGLTDIIVLTGFVSHLQIHQLYRKCSVFVLPSSREGVSVSLLEAMSSGCICIVSDITDNKDVIQHMYNGITFRTGDVEDLARKLRWVMSNPSELASIAANARQAAKRDYSLETVGNSLLQLLSRF
jgi:glycosyltransferase involved in cell wall biosynthesis